MGSDARQVGRRSQSRTMGGASPSACPLGPRSPRWPQGRLACALGTERREPRKLGHFTTCPVHPLRCPTRCLAPCSRRMMRASRAWLRSGCGARTSPGSDRACMRAPTRSSPAGSRDGTSPRRAARTVRAARFPSRGDCSLCASPTPRGCPAGWRCASPCRCSSTNPARSGSPCGLRCWIRGAGVEPGRCEPSCASIGASETGDAASWRRRIPPGPSECRPRTTSTVSRKPTTHRGAITTAKPTAQGRGAGCVRGRGEKCLPNRDELRWKTNASRFRQNSTAIRNARARFPRPWGERTPGAAGARGGEGR
jgi:hypothetical protein